MIVNKPTGSYYKIEQVHKLPAFFINVATASDMWMYLSSNGALAAGRQNPANSIFPYETDDRLHLATATGPKTIIRTESGSIWEPFDTGHDNPFAIQRNLYKRNTGDAIIFEEINETLGLQFSYRWETSEKYGLVRTSELINLGTQAQNLEIIDGVENVMPHGIAPDLAATSSCLTDAYKACEKFGERLAVYSLTSMIGDTPEPVEVLKANVVWQVGTAQLLLSSRQILNFVHGERIQPEDNSVGRKGAFLTYQSLTLSPNQEDSWLLVMDANLSQKEVIDLGTSINGATEQELRKQIEADIEKGTTELLRIVAVADGLQHTADKSASIRHYMNVLYNNMRGGVFLDGDAIDPDLFLDFVKTHDKGLAEREADFLASLKAVTTIRELHERAYRHGDPDLIRLSLEFLPLTFSRRHGDPSRPWNYFNVRVKDEEGNRIYSYEGNWRDIFQNWEAMALSFPMYIAPMIVKFLNASTVDGFNPYRINQDGIDWEHPIPGHHSGGFGYWGDHQIVYLNKLLEWLKAYAPGDFQKLIHGTSFTYADVPYELLPYDSILKDSKNTLRFNEERQAQIEKRVQQFGTDGRLMMAGNNILHTSFMEKLLVPILAKLSNLVPNGGIWMNTQRPEWNDANNAIVGNGLSMVTVYQLYRHLKFCQGLVGELAGESFVFSVEVKGWLEQLSQIYAQLERLSPRAFLDAGGRAYEAYRLAVYEQGFRGKSSLSASELVEFFGHAIQAMDATIEASKRADGMYESYNILTLTDDSLSVEPMFLMLEGQSAVLGSGKLSPEEALDLVQKMEASPLLSPEQQQFFLYPVKKLKTFVERNVIPQELVEKSSLLCQLLADGHDGFVLKDGDGAVRFHHQILQSSDVKKALESLQGTSYKDLAERDEKLILDIYEEVFAHKQFTGRSGIMYKYEGIGSIYWHQNSKFMLSLQEVLTAAAKTGNGHAKSLKDAYYRLRSGFGFGKGPKEWGAFPLEPHSHTPLGMPAQQPGMTGQVKEDILTRMAELGIVVKDGNLSFDPALLRQEEFLAEPDTFSYVNQSGELDTVALPAESLSFTVCRVPVVYKLAANNQATVYCPDGEVLHQVEGMELGADWSRKLFDGKGAIGRVEVSFDRGLMIA